MPRAKLQIHPLGLAVICFALLVWFIALGGVSGAAFQCAKGQEAAAAAAAAEAEATAAAAYAAKAAANSTTTDPVAAAALVAAGLAPPAAPISALAYASCAQAYQWEWFSLWFALALLLALFATAFLPDAFRRSRAALLAFTTLAALCLLLSAHNFITKVDISARVDVRNLDQDSVNAAAAGFVLLSMSMMVLMIALGKDFACAACSAAGAGGAHHGPLAGDGRGCGGLDYGAHVRYQPNPPI